jgi:hypothetical protein
MALTDRWHIVSGEWTIRAGRLFEPGTDQAIIMGLSPVPADSAGEMLINVDICDPVVGNVYRVYIGATNYTSDAGADWAEFIYISLNTWTVELSTGEIKTMTYSPVEAGVFPVWVCLDQESSFLAAAVASSGDEYPWSTDATAIGRYYGLGQEESDAGVEFDDFQVQELRTTGIICTSCGCNCDGNHLAKKLKLTLAFGTARAFCMTGTVEMNWEWNGGNYRWVSDVLGVTNGTGGADVEFKWIMLCGTYDPAHPFDHLGLYWHESYRTCCAGNPGGCTGVHVPIQDDSRCEGLYLKYGPFKLSAGEESCYACYCPIDLAISPLCYDPGDPTEGTFYIEITE